ncbi:hypothetical protein P8452_57391 [Trifolium repens]|nr:hypothetical protein P8452_57391 [Trifolium repens]
MMTIFFFWACVYSVDESPTRSESSIDEAFQKWMSDFDRTYANNTEMKKRREIFKKKLEFIDKFNSEGNHSYTVGLNQFSDLTEEECHAFTGHSYEYDLTIRGLSLNSCARKYLEEDYFYIECSWYVDESLKLSESEEASIDQEFQKWLLDDGWTYSRSTENDQIKCHNAPGSLRRLGIVSQVKFDKFVEQGRVLHNYASILELLLRLRQCCDHPFLVMSCGDTQEFSDLNKLAKRFLRGTGNASEGEVKDAVSRAYVEEVVEELRRGEQGECPICLEAFEDAVLTPCAHRLCQECLLASWRNSSSGLCPVCSNKMNVVDIENNLVESCKITGLLNELENLRSLGSKSIVFSQWTAFLDLLQIPFTRNKISFVRLDGTLNLQQREKVIKQFSEDSDIQDPWWNPAVEEQAVMRIRRIGQTKKVAIKRFIVKHRKVSLMEEDQNVTEPPNSDPVLNQQTPEAGGSFHHVINLNTGKDVMASLYEISAHYRRDVCVLCAAGALSSVVLRSSLGTYIRREGHFEIMSLTPTEKPGSFFASLADTNTGRVFGGVVVGSLIASGPLHFNVSDFKQSKEILKKNSASSSASAAGVSDNVNINPANAQNVNSDSQDQ